ncbi:hypothetical protein OEZ85_012204 [Tetradesmus obliquus]|uniref:Uncharacterized protein n=1 Tax=Tetradesmus obliquus TaxID=3088 RepID=A0ABY8TSM9_TETOB|nr:hypothetical protein OEZ85_012204 [Tetradesmus obliquus]
MAISVYDVKRLTLEEDGSGVEELHYNFKAAKKLGHLLTFTSLKQLNVAFNELSSCDGVEQLQQLQSLNLSHNQLSRLAPISALTSLTRYERSTAAAAAVVVRSNGSAALQWPDGAMAASLDPQADDSAGGYRLLAMYRSVVGVAASFDASGGFVQYPSGALMLVWNKKDGEGKCYAPDGSITHSFNSRSAALLSHSAAVVVGQAWPDSRRPNHRSIASSTAIAARRRNSKQERDSEAEQSIDEPQIDLGRRAEAISSHLQLHPADVLALVRRNPAIAALPLDKLCKGLPGLAHALGVPLRQALFMVARQPAVLDADIQQLLRSSEQLAAAVQLPAEQVMFMAARQPALLSSPARIAAEAQKLAAALGCSPRGALQLLSRLGSEQLHSVLSMSSSTVLQRLPEVVEALGLPSDSTRKLDMLHLVAKHPGLLAASLSDIGRSTDALLVAFQQSPPLTFAAVLGRCPSLLTVPAEQILANYQGLLLQLGVSRGTLARMLTKHPQLLRAAPDNIAAKLRAMAFQLYLPQGQVVTAGAAPAVAAAADAAQQ